MRVQVLLVAVLGVLVVVVMRILVLVLALGQLFVLLSIPSYCHDHNTPTIVVLMLRQVVLVVVVHVVEVAPLMQIAGWSWWWLRCHRRHRAGGDGSRCHQGIYLLSA